MRGDEINAAPGPPPALVEEIRRTDKIPGEGRNEACVAAPGAPRALLAALEVLGGWQVDAASPAPATHCDHLILGDAPPSVQATQGWELVARVQRPTDRNDIVAIYRRAGRMP